MKEEDIEKIVSFMVDKISEHGILRHSDVIGKIKNCLGNSYEYCSKVPKEVLNEFKKRCKSYWEVGKRSWVLMVYKLMSLSSEKDLYRIIEIICTNKFHCSTFSEMNDPMEGVYTYEHKHLVEPDLPATKNKYKICSFSGLKGFENPAMWGYYANGFKGIAIEVIINDESNTNIENIEKVVYKNNVPKANLDSIKEILTTKLKAWEHEDEYRYIINSEDSKQYIGKINHVYIGCPYGNTTNYEDIIEKSESLKKYRKYKEILEKFLKLKKIKYKYCFVGGDNKVDTGKKCWKIT